MCYNVEQMIEISSTMPLPLQASTLLHEVIEALDSRLWLKLPHETIQRLEAGLNQVLVDNPEFVAMYFEAE
jgi:hypothetical protein